MPCNIMADTIKGKQVIWGTDSFSNSLSAFTTNAGIVQSFSVSIGGASTNVLDEDGDIVSRVDSAGENKITLEVVALSGTVPPSKGTAITGLPTIDGIAFGTGRLLTDDAKVDYSNAAVKKISINATHYPSMGADV